jgi:molybdate transport system ATP-binding protein
MIEIATTHRLGNFIIDVRFKTEGSLTALFGVSGSGKSTLINIIAGLILPEQGFIKVGGLVLFDKDNQINVQRHKRRIGYVFQDARLFPHMSVRQNLNYGRWFTPAAERSTDTDHVVELLGLSTLLDRMPDHLSGGEKQRVAIGRALLSSPKLLLMDEPLASLDQDRKAEILPYIERLRDESKVPIIYVSHAEAEVSRLANDVIVLEAGKVIMVGSPAEIFQHRMPHQIYQP